MVADRQLREQLVIGLRGEDAHMTFEDAVAELPDDAVNLRPPGTGYTLWHLVEHLRIAQRDILEYVRGEGYVAPAWPDDYWPDATAEATPAMFRASVEAFLADRVALETIALDLAVDLFAPLPHAPQHTIARELRVIGNHNSYHVGELAILRGVTGTWGRGH
jgi:hypothetical protein